MIETQLSDEQLRTIYSHHVDCHLQTIQVVEAKHILVEKGFEVLDIIASNQTSLVFKGISMDTQQIFAIKLQVSRNLQVIEEYQRQHHILQSLQDQNLLKTHQIIYNKQNELLLVVMDLCVYGDLYSFIRGGEELSKEIIIDFSAQVVRSVLILHSQRIIHGDINPSNFLVDSTYTLKFSYQGASKFLYNTLAHTFSDPFSFAYSSKEQFQKDRPSVQSDLYSLGVVLLDLLGHRVDSCLDTMMNLKSRNIDYLMKVKEKTSNQYRDILEISLEFIQNENSIQTTEQSTIKLNQAYNKIINLKNNLNAECSQSELNQEQQQQLSVIQQEEQNKQVLSQKSSSINQFFKFLYSTTRNMMKETCFFFHRYFIQTLNLLILLHSFCLSMIGREKIQILKQDTKTIITFKDKEIQTVEYDESSNNTPAFKRSKFYDNKTTLWSAGSNKYNMPVEYEITTQYLDSEEDNSPNQNIFHQNKIDLDNLSSGGESDLSLDNIELNPRKSMSLQQPTIFHSANQLQVCQGVTHRLSNASTNYSASDSQVEERQREKQDSFSSQKISISPNKSPIQQQISSPDILFFPNGYYIGEVKNKLPHGQGKMYFHKGNRYEGYFVNGLYEGKGVYFYLGGNKYTGQWKNNLRDGHGMYKWANGTMYIGEYKLNTKTGKGTLKFSNGESYEGSFLENNFHGQGTYKFADGVKFEGQFEHGNRTSVGQFYLPNGKKTNNQNYRQIPDHKKVQNMYEQRRETENDEMIKSE